MPLLAIMLGLAAQAGAHREPPRILQIVRELLKPGREAEYAVVERQIAEACAALNCPHPYLAIESLSGPTEVWFFNGYASGAEQKQVAADYANNSAVMSALERLVEAKGQSDGDAGRAHRGVPARFRPGWRVAARSGK